MLASFSFPTTIIVGPGRRREMSERLEAMNVQRPLLVTDKGLIATGTFTWAIESLQHGYPIFSKIHSNPTADDVEAAVRAFEQERCDGVIAIGGGSALDVGKIVRLRARHPQWKLTSDLPTNVGELAPYIAVPTTAGTGSEVGRSSVITIAGKKRVIFHPSLLAKLVILDPELTLELPAKLTAATGADALTHCIESFTAPAFHPLCDGVALEGIHLICDALPRAVTSPRDVDARTKMLVAATMGGIAFQKDLGAAHSLAHPLSSICGLHHGLANALVLPAVMKFNAARKPGVYDRVATAMGVEDAVKGVENLWREIGIDMGLKSHGVREEQLDELVRQAAEDSCHETNPVKVRPDDLRQLYLEAM